MKILKSIRMFGILSLVCLVALSMASAASAAPDVCRVLPVDASPGDIITVTLNIALEIGLIPIHLEHLTHL